MRGDDAPHAPITVYSRAGCPVDTSFAEVAAVGAAPSTSSTSGAPSMAAVAVAAAVVRTAANGNETVPTVHIVDRWLINRKRLRWTNSPVADRCSKRSRRGRTFGGGIDLVG